MGIGCPERNTAIPGSEAAVEIASISSSRLSCLLSFSREITSEAVGKVVGAFASELNHQCTFEILREAL